MTLAGMLNAESVAVIGASRTETKRGYQAIRTLLDEKYEGLIYPVNPKEKRILGCECYANVKDIPGPVDIALIATPASTIAAVIQDCGHKGVQGAVILAGGFGETGRQGRQLEDEIVAIAHQHDMRLIGPNTSGMMGLKNRLNLVGLRGAPPGDIGLLTQSGNMALTLITEAKLKSLKGFSYYVGVGNEADIKFHEYLEFFHQDPDTRAILIYVEGMRDGRKFLQQAYKTTIDKPIVMLKSGRSSTGRKAAGSHTGALAGISEVARGAFQRAGIIVIENPDELFPAAEALSSLPPIKNNQIAILADGGGHATIAADLLTDLGVTLPELSLKTQVALQKILPAAATVTNPVDVAGGTDEDPSVFADCARIILKDSNIGGLLIVGLFGGYGLRFAASLALKEEDAAHQMGKMVTARNKPIIVHSLYSSAKPHALDLLRYYGIPVYDSLDVACKGIGVLAEYGRYLKRYHAKAKFVLHWGVEARPEGQQIIQAARADGRTSLLESEAKLLLQIQGASKSRDELVTSADQATQFVNRIKGPVAMKIVSPDILHKTDAGGVALNVQTESEVREAYDGLLDNARAYDPKADIRGVLMAPMAEQGVEVIIGTKVDDQFGPIIMYGLGGVMVEILKDVAFRILPISRLSAEQMIQETKSFPILGGVRGTSPSDKKALVNLLLLCSRMIEAYPDIQEMDLNPVIVHTKGISIVDARILLSAQQSN